MRPLFLIIFFLTVGISAYASGKYDSIIYAKKANIALTGYDAVSFFANTAPLKGVENWQTGYRKAVWYFSSEENLNIFKDNPEKYSPAYGGYCAWAMNNGKLAPGKPQYWDIIEGKLYLNYSTSTRKKFLEEINSMIRNGDLNWPGVEAELIEIQDFSGN